MGTSWSYSRGSTPTTKAEICSYYSRSREWLAPGGKTHKIVKYFYDDVSFETVAKTFTKVNQIVSDFEKTINKIRLKDWVHVAYPESNTSFQAGSALRNEILYALKDEDYLPSLRRIKIMERVIRAF
jgi:chlorite dismutase